MAGLAPYYLLQSSFASGEISPEVANRVDLDKYESAVLTAYNCLIKPYGPIYRRPGLKYIARAKNNNQTAILVPFAGSNNKDFLLEIGVGYIRIYKEGTYVTEIATSFTLSDLTNLRFVQSADTLFIASGRFPVKTLIRYSDTNWNYGTFEITDMYYDLSIISSASSTTITPSAKTGTVTLTASASLFTSDMVGTYVKLKQNVPGTEASTSNGTTSTLKAGDGWKIITHGTWAGTVEVQKSDDGTTWTQYRKYSGSSDFNPTESGNVSEACYIRAVCSITSGTCNCSLSTLPYDKEGTAKITKYNSATSVTASVIDEFGTTTKTTVYYFGAWSEKFGYPKTIAFFQDRLVFGGTSAQPYMLWMSRTGDYGNFSVEKASGSVTDDSAIAIGLVSRKQFTIQHLMASTDLLILTAGNEWVISGSETVTPSSSTAKMQTTRGTGNIEPISVGNRIVFVQGRGSTVRDLGYSYETDSYGGNELTLLAKHIIQNNQLVDCAYKQEPDSTLYFVRDDGTLACLSYIYEQKVYAWSTIETQGQIEAITALAEGNEDIVYVLVKRTIGGTTYRNIEAFNNNYNGSSDPDDYMMLDCAVKLNSTEGQKDFTCATLAGATVDVLADDRRYENIEVDSNGEFSLPAAVNKAVVGLPYESIIELPNVEIKGNDGTIQGRFKQVSQCTLRLNNSLGGSVGYSTDGDFDEIQYDELSAVSDLQLFSGDKKITLPLGGFNNEGRIVIKTDEPYPFNLLCVVREVTFGG